MFGTLRVALVCALFCVGASAQSASYPRLVFDPTADANYLIPLVSDVRALSLPNGDTVLVGTARQALSTVNGPETHLLAHIIRIGGQSSQCCVNGNVYPGWGAFGGSGNTIPRDAAVDLHGNIWIAGITDSDDFPLVNALYTQKVAYQTTGFVTEIDPATETLVFSTYFGGTKGPAGGSGTTEITGIGFDAQGNVYLAGDTDQSDAPATLPLLGVPGPAFATNGQSYDVRYGLIARLVPPANGSPALGWSVLFGGTKPYCIRFAATFDCLSDSGDTQPLALAVDAAGNATVAGTTNEVNFPVTAGAFQQDCNCNYGVDTGFVARIAADGKSLLWATYLGADSYSSGLVPVVTESCGTTPNALALDSAGDVFVAGTTCGPFPVSAGALQASRPGKSNYSLANGFVARLASDGKSLPAATYLGGLDGSTIAGVAVDRTGNAWVGGTTTSPDFPSSSTTPALGSDFIVGLSPDFASAPHLYRMPAGSVSDPPVFDSAGDLVLLAAAGVAVRLDPANAFAGNAIFSMSNSAVLQSQAGLGPAELSTILGTGLGPAGGASATPDASGAFPTQLVGVQVLIDGTAAPLLYVSANQINFQAPSSLGITSEPHTLAVVIPGGTLGAYRLNFVPTVGVFRNPATGGAAALNQDYSINSPSNPAKPGSIVMLYATVAGVISPFLPVGLVATSASPTQGTSGEVIVYGTDGPYFQLYVYYAGNVPGLIDGVVQINVQLPAFTSTDPVPLTVAAPGFGASDTVQVFMGR